MQQKNTSFKSVIWATLLVSGLLAWNMVTPGGRAFAAGSTACTPSGTTYGTDTLSLSIPLAGTYTIWSRIQVPSTPSGAPLLLNIDNATGTNCYNVGSSSTPSTTPPSWVWVNSGQQVLTQGTHSFVYTGLQSGASLDKIEVLSDSTCTPVDNLNVVPIDVGNNCTPVGDTTPPTVSVTAPTNGATVSGTTTISANASDDVAVANVQFKLDGVNLGSADTTSPYSFSWDTTSASNGSHTLTAVATDTSNNTTTSSAVTVTVSNSSGTTLPTTPAGLHTTASTATSASLAWTASTDSGGPGLAGYRLYRNGNLVATIAAPNTTYIDGGLTPGTSYAYTIAAYDTSNNASTVSSPTNVTSGSLIGDLDGDGHVTGHDLSILLANYGQNYVPAELDGGTAVEGHDLSILLSNYGQ